MTGGPSRDLFTPMNLESMFKPPPGQAHPQPTPTRLQHMQLPGGTPPKHRLAGSKGSMIPLPSSVIAGTPPRGPSPAQPRALKVGSPQRPQTQPSQSSQDSEVPGLHSEALNISTPITSPVQNQKHQSTLSQESVEQQFVSGIPHAKLSYGGPALHKAGLPLQSVQLNRFRIKLGARAAHYTATHEIQRAGRFGNENVPPGKEANKIPARIADRKESLVRNTGYHATERDIVTPESEQSRLGEGVGRYQTNGGSAGFTPLTDGPRLPPPEFDETSVYPSSPPWLPRGSPSFASHSALVPYDHSSGEEDLLPPNEMDAVAARARNDSPPSSGKLLSHTPVLPTPPQLFPIKKPRPLPTSPDDPFNIPIGANVRPLPPPRTPSPAKAVAIDSPSKSPLKLFAGRYDTFTKQTLVRRISQLEGEAASQNKETSELNSDHFYGSNPDISVIEPLGTPISNLPPYKPTEDAITGLRRSRQRGDSSSSVLNDGVNGPKFPVKERTPKRLRRSLSGGSKLKQAQSAQVYEDDSAEKMASKETQTQGHARRNSAPSPSPHPRQSVDSTSSSSGLILLQDSDVSARDSAAPDDSSGVPVSSGEFLSSGELRNLLIENGLRGLGIGEEMDYDERKGSVTTQDFLAEAEEVMGRIRAAREGNGKDQSWLSDPTTGIESLLTEAEQNLPPEEVNRIKAKFLANLAAQKRPDLVIPERQTSQAKSNTSTLVEPLPPKPQQVTNVNSAQVAYSGSEGGTTRRYPGPTGQKTVIDALCAAVAQDKYENGHAGSATSIPHGRNVGANGEAAVGSRMKNRATSAESHSSKSDLRHIHPTQVEHLIPKSIGAMTFDPVQKAWVRTKTPGRERVPPASSDGDDGRVAGNNTTEEDPFQGISDLSVDEEVEARALMDASRMQEMISELEEYVIEDSPSESEYTYESKKVVRRIEREEIRRELRERNATESQQDVNANMSKPTLIEDSANFPVIGDDYDSSSWMQQQADGDVTEGDITVATEPLHQNVGSSGASVSPQSSPDPEGRAGTRSTFPDGTMEPNAQGPPPIDETISHLSTHSEEGSESEDEVNSHSDRGEETEIRGSRAGDHSTDFSSPLSREVRGAKNGRLNKSRAGGGDSLADLSFQSATRAKHGVKPYRIFSARNTPFNRRMSSGGRSFVRRPVSRIDEEDGDEDTPTADTGNTTSVSSALTPLPSRGLRGPATTLPSSIRRVNVSFHLSSPLPELSYQFETTRDLLNLELTYIARRHPGGRKVSSKELECSFSLAQDELLRHLTDVEPFEAYWEYMKYLKLNSRKILTLHGLHEWCPRIEELDVCGNEVGQLSGVPNTVRNLKITNNQLSGLTAWGHLTNLQYLDVSKNSLDSLAGEPWTSCIGRRVCRTDWF